MMGVPPDVNVSVDADALLVSRAGLALSRLAALDEGRMEASSLEDVMAKLRKKDTTITTLEGKLNS